MILLDKKERRQIPVGFHYLLEYKEELDWLLRIQAKKILIELQAIYNLPDGGMFNKKLGEFIKSLQEEVG